MTSRIPRLHAYEWSDWSMADLLRAKERRGTKVSLVLPARDEAGTVGDIVTRVRKELVEEAPLLDEIVVIDSDSSDATAQVAREAGATVHAASAVRRDLGRRGGKGEAIWKSMFVTSGDVLVFMDADLTEWDTHFVTGLMGPLLCDGLELAKGFYDRPMGTEQGGRVTELVARPLLALHWPALAEVVQPLAGEWAVRRRLLERIALPTGYAVDLAVLIEACETAGLDAIAQVDLGLRKHGHQGLPELGAMSLQILAMAQARLGAMSGPEELSLRQYDWASGRAVPGDRAVDLRERPPAVCVAGYADVVPEAGGAASC